MNTFEKDGWRIRFFDKFFGTVVLRDVPTGNEFRIPAAIIGAWLDHAGYVLVPKESMAAAVNEVLMDYDVDKVERELDAFINEPDDSEEGKE